ncbi:MAG: hypothetical protein ACQEVA_19970, partial [Myxococcota bacterium]
LYPYLGVILTRTIHTTFLLAVVALFVAGCPDESETPSPSDTGATDTSDTSDTSDDVENADTDDTGGEDQETSDPNCHYDCFAHYTCENGEVYWQSGGPIPCEVGGAELCTKGDKVGDCQEGCRIDEDELPSNGPDGWPIMCEENRPRGVGEPCSSDDDCSPAEDHYDAATDEYVEKQLTCDTTAGECVDPNAPGYRNFCDAEPTEIEDGLGYLAPDGDVALPGCNATSYCAVEQNADKSCQICTIECNEDADCPSGSFCTSSQNLDQFDDTIINLCIPSDWQQNRDITDCIDR